MKTKSAVISCEPYRESFYLVVCSRKEAMEQIRNIEHFAGYDYPFDNCDGRFVTTTAGHAFMWLNSSSKKADRVAALAHEFVHVISYLFETRGIKYDCDNDEPAAYMMQYLMKQALDAKII